MRVASLILLALVSAAGLARGREPTPLSSKTGVLCLRKLPGLAAFADEGKGSAIPGQRSFRRPAPTQRPLLQVYVDEGPGRFVERINGNCIEGLSLGGRHVAHIYRDGKQLESVRFRFVEGRTLVLRYDPFYAHVHITALRGRRTVADDGTCATCPDIPGPPVLPKFTKRPSEGGEGPGRTLPKSPQAPANEPAIERTFVRADRPSSAPDGSAPDAPHR